MADHIQIGDIAPRVRYTGDGETALFTYPFPVFAAADLEVYVDGVLQTLTDDYTVAGAGQSSGGSVTFLAVPATGTAVTLLRRLEIKRTSDFQASGEFRAKVINDELDFQTATLQQIADDLGRSIRLSRSDADAVLELPAKVSRADRVLAFNADGDVIVSNESLPEIEGAATSAMAASISAASASASADAAAESADDADAARIAAEAAQAAATAGIGGIKVSADDTAPNDLESKLLVGDGLALSTQNAASNETRTIDLAFASQADAEAGTATDKPMHALRVAQAISAIAGIGEDPIARDMAASALAYALAQNDAASITGGIGNFMLTDNFESDSLAVKINANYDASGDMYSNPGELSDTDAVPVMTANSYSGVTLSGSSEIASLEFYRLFDNNGASTYWSASTNSNEYISIEFSPPKKIANYRFIPRSVDSNDLPMAPTSFRFEGWNGSGWVILDTHVGISWGHAYQSFNIAAPASYTKYRLYCVSNSSGYPIAIGDMELFELLTPEDITLAPSPAALALANPNDVLGYFVVNPGSAAFDLNGDAGLGDDIVGRISIDSGSTWAIGTWRKVGNISVAGEELWCLEADVSTESGASLVYQITTHNAQVVELHDCVGLIPIY